MHQHVIEKTLNKELTLITVKDDAFILTRCAMEHSLTRDITSSKYIQPITR